LGCVGGLGGLGDMVGAPPLGPASCK
jgi:hypothetical protein